MNLLKDKWIPVFRQKDGGREVIAPWEITGDIINNPIIMTDAPRPDFNGALIQFLIGIIQTIMTPEGESDWINHYSNPPTPKNLNKAMEKFYAYFNLKDDKAPFMQESGLESDKTVGIGNLLLEAPGDNTLKENRDHFIKRGNVENICPSCIAMSIFTLQTNAPSGGAGHRTSLRGGGPLTTIAIPDGNEPKYNTLWHRIWLNILLKKDLRETGCNESLKKDKDIFPWIKPIKISKEKGTETTSDEIHPFQIFWSLPRRIKLNPQIHNTINCDICGKETEASYDTYITKPHGINYADGIYHPLTPYYSDKDGLKIAVHPQPGGFTYRHWPAYVTSNDPNKPRALVLQKLDKRLRDLKRERMPQSTRILVFGYDMDNMKARCWYETQMPYWLIPETVKNSFIEYAKNLAEAARNIASNTRGAVKNAWFDPGETVRGDMSFIEQEFWDDTETDYYNTLLKILKVLEAGESIQDGIDRLKEEWLLILNRKSLQIYDYYSRQVSLDAGKTEGVPRVIKARDKLRLYNTGKYIREKTLFLAPMERV